MSGLPSPLGALPGGRLSTPGVPAAVERLRSLGTEPYAWSNGAGDRYAPHDHAFTKFLLCAEGSITFLVGTDEEPVELQAGDGFELPPSTRHAAIVGPHGCTCVEGHLQPG